jgi:hypothetical protein
MVLVHSDGEPLSSDGPKTVDAAGRVVDAPSGRVRRKPKNTNDFAVFAERNAPMAGYVVSNGATTMCALGTSLSTLVALPHRG